MDQLSIFDGPDELKFPQDLLEFTPGFLQSGTSLQLLELFIRTVPWQQQSIRMYGKTLLTPRMVAWYGDTNTSYSFSGTRFSPLPWTDELKDLKEKISTVTGLTFNSVLLNYYRGGNDSVAWHSDNERELGERPAIASLSVGQTRQFEFRNKKDHTIKYALQLTSGALLIMKGGLQEDWEHRIPKSPKENKPRINLTFRTIHS